MIFDRFEGFEACSAIGSRVRKAVEFASGLTAESKEGKYEIDGDLVFAEISTYQSRNTEKALFESHRKYIDVQVVLSGREYIGVYKGQMPESTEDYSLENDVQFYNRPENYSRILMEPGSFLVLYPDDYHCPGCRVDGSSEIKKVVVKVAVKDLV